MSALNIMFISSVNISTLIKRFLACHESAILFIIQIAKKCVCRYNEIKAREILVIH